MFVSLVWIALVAAPTPGLNGNPVVPLRSCNGLVPTNSGDVSNLPEIFIDKPFDATFQMSALLAWRERHFKAYTLNTLDRMEEMPILSGPNGNVLPPGMNFVTANGPVNLAPGPLFLVLTYATSTSTISLCARVSLSMSGPTTVDVGNPAEIVPIQEIPIDSTALTAERPSGCTLESNKLIEFRFLIILITVLALAIGLLRFSAIRSRR